MNSPAKKSRGFPFNAVEIALDLMPVITMRVPCTEQGRDGRLNVDYRVCDEGSEHDGQHDRAPDQQTHILNRLALVERHHFGDTLRFNPERAAKDDRQ